MEFWSGHHPNGALYQDKLIGKLAQNGIFEDLAALLMSSVRQLEDAPVGGPQNARGGVASTSVPSTTPAMPVEAPASGYMQDIAGATAVLFQRYAAARDKALSSLPKARLAQLLHILCVPFVFARCFLLFCSCEELLTRSSVGILVYLLSFSLRFSLRSRACLLPVFHGSYT